MGWTGRRDNVTVRDSALLVRFMILDRAFLSVDVYVDMGPTSRALLMHSRITVCRPHPSPGKLYGTGSGVRVIPCVLMTGLPWLLLPVPPRFRRVPTESSPVRV